MIGGSPWLSPLESVKDASKVVDVGCGTGVATMQIAKMLPKAQVYGLDLSPIPEGTLKLAPKNISWAQGNILEVNYDKPADDVMSREIFTRGNLDWIFGRMLFLGLDNWPKYFENAAKALKSGGIIEHQDVDWQYCRIETNEGLSDNWDWHRKLMVAIDHNGLARSAGSDASSHMEKNGLEIISKQAFEFSFVPSAKTPRSQAMGRYVQAKLLPNFPELLRKILKVEGYSKEEEQKLIDECLRDLKSEEGLHLKYTVTVARKK
jgi:SAM-dependent methyltransferase